MDTKLLKEQLQALSKQAEKITYKSLPKTKHGYPNALSSDWYAWAQRTENIITENFKRDSAPINLIEKGRKSESSILRNGPDKFNRSKKLIVGAISEALEAIESDFYSEIKHLKPSQDQSIDPEKIFIVHGHDHETKNELELFVREIGLEPVVLHREADEGQTIIEKFEKHSSVGYAFILLTPDDEVIIKRNDNGNVKQTEFQSRPNVLFEFGYFVAHLGRNRVCCIANSKVSLPSDISGLIYKQFKDNLEEVKYSLVKELRKANYDANL